MRILITGGFGFIGSFLVSRLLENERNELVVLDNLSNNKVNYIKGAKFVKGDVRNSDDVKKAIDELGGCDTIFHLAAQQDVQFSIENPMLDHDINVLGTKNIVDVCKENKAKIIFTSSAAVYGNVPEDRLPIKEEEEKNPLSPYGKNKLKAEELCKEAKYFIVRLFNVYGPTSNSVINKFCDWILRGEPLILNNPGNHTRDYVYVSDVVDALILGMKKDGIYNVGSGIETSLTEIIEIISRLTNKTPKLVKGEQVKEIKRSVADISKIKKLGWSPKTTLENGIKNVLESLK